MWNCNCSSWLKWCWEKYNSTAIGTFLWGLLTFILIINFIFLLWVGEECCASIGFFFLQPSRGCITVSGEDVRTFDKSEWARVVSIVNQVCTYSYISDTCINACDPTSHLVWSFDVELVRLTNEESFKVLFRYDWFWPNEHTLPIYIYIYIAYAFFCESRYTGSMCVIVVGLYFILKCSFQVFVLEAWGRLVLGLGS